MARPGIQGDFAIDAERRGNSVATAWTLLEHLAAGREGEAWEVAQALAKGALDDPKVTLARGVLEAGPFAMRRAVELVAELMVSAEAEPSMASAG